MCRWYLPSAFCLSEEHAHLHCTCMSLSSILTFWVIFYHNYIVYIIVVKEEFYHLISYVGFVALCVPGFEIASGLILSCAIYIMYDSGRSVAMTKAGLHIKVPHNFTNMVLS